MGGSYETDSLLALKKKNNKIGDDSRYQGTTLGKEAEQMTVPIVGGAVASIHEWDNLLRVRALSVQLSSPSSPGSLSSAPATPMDDAF